MKLSKKLLAVILSLIMVFSAVIPAVSASDTVKASSIISTESPVFTTEQYLSILNPIKTILRTLSGKAPDYESNFSLEFRDGVATELCNYIRDNSGLDIISLLQETVDLDTTGLEYVYELTGADTTAIRDALYSLRFKADEKGQSFPSILFYFLGNYLSVIKKVEIYTIPYGDDGTTRVCIDIVRMDGTAETIPLDLYFSPDSVAYGQNGNGILGLGYECSVYDLLIYATVNCWMRSFGFCLFYDIFCYTTPFFNYVTRRFKFDYADKEWMVQVWKGNYVVANGSEVGIYNREKGSFGSYYDCYDGLMNMSLKLSYGDEIIYDISGEHWWMNGFKLGKTLYKPNSMTMEFSIELIDEEMANALADSINNHYRHDVSCTVNNKTVTAVW